MGVYIKGMDMPKSCYDCDIGVCICNRYYDPNFDINDTQIKRHPDCPLVEVKDPHGRLIDADELIAKHEKEKIRDYDFHVCAENWIANAPTVLEAEG